MTDVTDEMVEAGLLKLKNNYRPLSEAGQSVDERKLVADILEAALAVPARQTQVRPITLDVLRDYFKAMDAGDVPDRALALYSYLLMDGFIDKDAAKADIRTALSPEPRS
jgi:hypothetical protein